MNVAVRYYSKTGNTKKLAEEIARVLGVTAQTVENEITTDTDILFLGSSVYAAGVDGSIRKFIEDLNPDKVKKVVNFSTAALLPSTFKQVKELVSKKNIEVDDREYHCRGSFGIMHRNKPDKQDLENVQKFVQTIINI